MTMMTALVFAVLWNAPEQSPPNPIAWSVRPIEKAVTPGSTIAVRLTATIDAGWHLYALSTPAGGPIATEISLPPGQAFTFVKPISAPKPHEVFDDSTETLVGLYSGRVEFTLPLRVSATAPAGQQTLTVYARYQSCNDTICLPPRTAKVSLTVDVRGG